MTVREFLKEIHKDRKQKEILRFFEDRWLGEVLSIDDFYDMDEELNKALEKDCWVLKEFMQVLEIEKKLIGTKDFLTDKIGYPKPNYAGFEYPSSDDGVLEKFFYVD
jgi:hypothetical protein